MNIFSIIWNVLCLALCVAMAVISKTTALDGVVFGILLSAISWGVINILLALFVRKRDAFARKCKAWRTFYGFIASVIVASFCIVYIAKEGTYPIWNIVAVVAALFAIRGLFAWLYSNKRIARLLEQSLVLDKSEEGVVVVKYKRASRILPKVVDVVIPPTEEFGFYKEGKTIAFISFATQLAPITAPADCVCAWLAFDKEEELTCYKVASGVNICALATAPKEGEI